MKTNLYCQKISAKCKNHFIFGPYGDLGMFVGAKN